MSDDSFHRKFGFVRGTLPTGRVSAFVLIMIFSACIFKNEVSPGLSSKMPQKILWAWERPEDLRFLDPKEFGVAFLAQTILLEKESVSPKPRRQPLEIAPGTYLIAVTRLETNKLGSDRPSLDEEMIRKVVGLIGNTIDLPDVDAVQIDFDAVVSERAFYRAIVKEIRKLMPPDAPLTMTALASWCTSDLWFNDFPVDGAIPMVFQMGADNDKIRSYLRKGNDWREPLCRNSYGVSIDETPPALPMSGRRMFYFNRSGWTRASVASLAN